jgi:arsenite oxidase small subunit
VTAAGAAVTTIVPNRAEARGLAQIDYASNRLANVKDLKVNQPLNIAYPDKDSPGVLLKLGKAVDGGVGPDRDIVAFSTLCPHKGWLLTYRAADKTLNCQGHFSRFDCEAGGQQVWGHATQNLPQFTLRIDGKGDIFAEGVSDLIFGRPANVI